MPWFKVDDSFHSNPKVLAARPAALGLWVVAGSWSSQNLTDGFISDQVLPRLLPGAAKLARELVAVGLWIRAEDGFRFHDWATYNPTANAVKAKRNARADAGRKGGLASGKTRAARSKQRSNGEANASGDASSWLEPPSRPGPFNTSLSTQLPVDPQRASNGEREKDQQEGQDNPETQTLKTMVELGASVAEATRIIGDIRREGRIHSPAGWLASPTGRADFAERLAGIRPSDAAPAPPARLGCDDCQSGWLNEECTKPCLRCKPHLARHREGVTP